MGTHIVAIDLAVAGVKSRLACNVFAMFSAFCNCLQISLATPLPLVLWPKVSSTTFMLRWPAGKTINDFAQVAAGPVLRAPLLLVGADALDQHQLRQRRDL